MSFGGHVLDMVKRNNQNQALRKKHRTHIKQQATTFKVRNKARKISYPKMSAEELRAFKDKVQKKSEDQRKILILKIIPFTIAAIVIIAILFHIIGRIIADYLREI